MLTLKLVTSGFKISRSELSNSESTFVENELDRELPKGLLIHTSDGWKLLDYGITVHQNDFRLKYWF